MYETKIGKKIVRIACVQLDHTFPTVFDKVVFPRYGLPLIGSILQHAGYEVKVFEEHVASIDEEWVLGADVLLLSALTGAANRTYEFAAWAKAKNPNIVTIMGGEHATNFIEESLDWVDFVIRGEGDEAILGLIKAIENDGPFKGLGRVSYRDNGTSVHNPITASPTDLGEIYDIDIIHKYPKERGLGMLIKHKKIKMVPVQASRGCPFSCSFCVVHKLFGRNYRYRETESVIDDIKEKLAYGKDFLFVDNPFTGNSRKVDRILDRMIEEGFSEVAEFRAFSRIDIAEQPDMLRKLRKAGFRTLIVGIESLDNNTLYRVSKRQSLDKINRSIKAIHDADLLISATYIVGNEEDCPGSVDRIVKFSLNNNLSQIILLSFWAYPGDAETPLSPERLIMPSFDYFGGNYVVHFPRRMKPSTLQREMMRGLKEFWSLKRCLKNALKLNFRTAIQILFHHYAYLGIWRQQVKYAAYLESIERDYYDEEENLVLERIRNRPLDQIVERASKVSGLTINRQLQEYVPLRRRSVVGDDNIDLVAVQ